VATKHRPLRQCEQRGFTLLELTIVLALLAALAALSWPALKQSMASLRLRRAADQVRAAWAAARHDAVTEGAVIAFWYRPRSDRYQVEPLARLAEASSGSPTAGRDRTSSQPADDATGTGRERQLPEGVHFASGRLLTAGSTETVAATDPGLSAAATRILFFPDGTTWDATLTLEDERQWTVSLTLRGVTATSKAGDVLPPAPEQGRRIE